MAEVTEKQGNVINHWTFVLPVGALTLLGALMLSVSNEAAVGLKMAEQHGESILLLREEVRLLRLEIKERTHDRYTTRDAERDLNYIRLELAEIKEAFKDHEEHKESKK
jgi:hypothetical protein